MREVPPLPSDARYLQIDGNSGPPAQRSGLRVRRAERTPRGSDDVDPLGVFADLLAGLLDELVAERIESLAPSVTEPPEPGWLRVSEVARRVGASQRTVYRALRSGALAGERLGTHWRIRPEAVAEWLSTPRPEHPPASGRGTAVAPPRGKPQGANQPTAFKERARQSRSARGDAIKRGGATAPRKENR